MQFFCTIVNIYQKQIIQQQILDKISEVLGIGAGECSADGKFSLEACRCIGACGLAPVCTINGEVYGKVTADDIPGILAKYMD